MDFIINEETYRKTIFENYYITNFGKVAIIKFEENKLKSYFLLRNETTKDGYFRVEINGKHIYVHRLVYQTWSGEELNKELVIDHIDANTKNNDIHNLRQVTQKQNINNAIVHGNFGHNGNTRIKLTNTETNEIKYFESVKSFLIYIDAPPYMIRHNSISCLSKRKEYKKYHVEKIDEH